MNNNRKGDSAISSFFWRLAERIGAKLVNLVVSIVLARILLPEQYGTVALINIFITIFQVFVDGGLGAALIQKKDADDIDFSSVFYFNLFTCTFFYILVYALSPAIAGFYNDESITPMIRVAAMTILISGLKGVQQAYVSRNMLFRRFFFSTIGGTIFSAILGIILAIKGFGAWALVIQQVSNLFVDTLILWMTVKWRPKLLFSFIRLKALLMYGFKLLVTGIIDVLYNNVRSLIIGKYYSESDLAFFNKAKQFPDLIVSNVNTSINSVMLTVVSREQDDRMRCKELTRKSIQLTTYVLAPILVGLAVVSEPLVSFLLTDKWLPCVPYLRIFCFTYFFLPINTSNLNAMASVGEMNAYMKLAFIEKIIGVGSLLMVANKGVWYIAMALVITTPVVTVINMYPNRKYINYSIFEEIKDICPNMALACFMGVLVYPIQLLMLPKIVVILLQVMAGAFVYLLGSIIIKHPMLYYLKEKSVNMIKGKGK